MNQKGFANIVLVVVIAILVGVIGYFAFVKKSEPITQQPTPIPTQTKTPVSPTPDPTASWETYTNTKYGISIKYPTYNKELNKNIGVYVLDDERKETEEGAGSFWGRISLIIWHERYEKRGNYKIDDKCASNEQETCYVYSLSPLVLKVLNNYSEPYPDQYTLIFPTEKFELTVGPLPHNITNEELDQIISAFKFTTAKIQTPTPNKNIFVNKPYGLQFTMPSGYFAESNHHGVIDASKAEAFYFIKESNNNSGISVLDVSTNLEPSSGQNLNQFAQSIYLLNKDKNQVTTELKQTSYGGAVAYEFGLQTAFSQPVGGQLLDLPGAKVVFLQQGGKTFKFLQTGVDSGLTSILNSLKFK